MAMITKVAHALFWCPCPTTTGFGPKWLWFFAKAALAAEVANLSRLEKAREPIALKAY